MSERPILEVRNLKKHFAVRKGMFGEKTSVKAVDGVSFSVMPQESFAVVGESGCGKTTLGKLVLALEKPTAGQVFFDGVDMATMTAGAVRKLRREMQVIFQDPYSSLNPRMTVEDIITEPWVIHGMHKDPAERAKKLAKLLDDCGIAKTYLPRHPHEFSGGQRQRVGIARALALDPRLVIADEPVSALDVSIQAQDPPTAQRTSRKRAGSPTCSSLTISRSCAISAPRSRSCTSAASSRPRIRKFCSTTPSIRTRKRFSPPFPSPTPRSRSAASASC